MTEDEWERDTLAWRLADIARRAKELGAADVTAGLDQLNARLRDERDTRLFEENNHD